MGVLISVFLPLALAFIMFSLGLSLTIDDFKRVLLRPFAFLIGAINQMVLLPLLALAIALIFALPPELAVGLMILSFCPGGVTSNIMAKLARGDVALSVSLTAVISLASIITVPILVAWAVARFMGADAPSVSITGLAVSMFLITTLPVLLGLAVRHYATEFANRAMPTLTRLASILFLVIVLGALASNWAVFLDNLPVLGPALIVLNVLLLAIGFVVPKLLGLSGAEIKTIMVETGIQNSTVGITLGAIISAQAAGFSAYALPAAVYGITMYVISLPVILAVRNR